MGITMQEKKLAELADWTKQIEVEVETNDINNRQQDDEIRKELDSAIDQLTSQFTKKHQQTIDLLNQVKKDLNSSKTDRKTLAKLLASVANDLSTDEDQ